MLSEAGCGQLEFVALLRLAEVEVVRAGRGRTARALETPACVAVDQGRRSGSITSRQRTGAGGADELHSAVLDLDLARGRVGAGVNRVRAVWPDRQGRGLAGASARSNHTALPRPVKQGGVSCGQRLGSAG